jgi:threonine dehydrogenase-like Zn-dependent dehydrogenase
MDAVAIRRGETAPTVVEKPRPEPAPGEALVRTLRVGVDGTDREVVADSEGRFPAGEDHLVLGHEAVGVVVDGNGTDLSTGTVVAPTVRRPHVGGSNDYFDRGEPEMAPPEAVQERGIHGAHGFMADYFTCPEQYLVPMPDRLSANGFLVEPLSVVQKALEHVRVSRSTFEWRPESALVLGCGSLGLLALATLDAVERTYCLDRRDRSHPAVELVEQLGARYVDARDTSVADVADAHEPMNLVFEATGHAPHAFAGIEALAPTGALALLGLPSDATFEIDGGQLHRDLVVNNKAVVGSVNAGVDHARAAVDSLAGLSEEFLDEFVTDVHGPDAVDRALAPSESAIKTAVELGEL